MLGWGSLVRTKLHARDIDELTDSVLLFKDSATQGRAAQITQIVSIFIIEERERLTD